MKDKIEAIMEEAGIQLYDNWDSSASDMSNLRAILEKHLQEPTEERGEERKIYILKNNYYGSIDIFNKKDATHYIQYQKKWDDRLKVKHWTLQELVWDYEYWDDIMNIELIEKIIVV